MPEQSQQSSDSIYSTRSDRPIEKFGVYIKLSLPVIFFIAVALDIAFDLNFFITFVMFVLLIITACLFFRLLSRLYTFW